MKVIIVFLGLLIVNVTFLTYQGDIGRYVHGQTILKATAEECAAGAALLLEEEAFSQGQIVFDKVAAQEHADGHLAYVMKGFDGGETAYYECALSFEDDECGYEANNVDQIPAVTATIKVKTGDLFRLPFFTVTDVVRKAKYELVY